MVRHFGYITYQLRCFGVIWVTIEKKRKENNLSFCETPFWNTYILGKMNHETQEEKSETGLEERKKRMGDEIEQKVTRITRKLPHQHLGPHTTCFPNITASSWSPGMVPTEQELTVWKPSAHRQRNIWRFRPLDSSFGISEWCPMIFPQEAKMIGTQLLLWKEREWESDCKRVGKACMELGKVRGRRPRPSGWAGR